MELFFASWPLSVASEPALPQASLLAPLNSLLYPQWVVTEKKPGA